MATSAFFAHHSDMPSAAAAARPAATRPASRTGWSAASIISSASRRLSRAAPCAFYRLGHQQRAGDYVEFEPLRNSLVVFPSWVRHEVRRVSCPDCSFEDSRFAVNAWLLQDPGERADAGGEIGTKAYRRHAQLPGLSGREPFDLLGRAGQRWDDATASSAPPPGFRPRAPARSRSPAFPATLYSTRASASSSKVKSLARSAPWWSSGPPSR